jgi:hypothetical protein
MASSVSPPTNNKFNLEHYDKPEISLVDTS